MSYIECVTYAVVYLMAAVACIQLCRSYDRKVTRALDAMIEVDEQGPHGPYHLIYRSANRGLIVFKLLFTLNLYYILKESHHVYTLITAG